MTEHVKTTVGYYQLLGWNVNVSCWNLATRPSSKTTNVRMTLFTWQYHPRYKIQTVTVDSCSKGSGRWQNWLKRHNLAVLSYIPRNARSMIFTANDISGQHLSQMSAPLKMQGTIFSKPRRFRIQFKLISVPRTWKHFSQAGSRGTDVHTGLHLQCTEF